jgi:hypothetical protein
MTIVDDYSWNTNRILFLFFSRDVDQGVVIEPFKIFIDWAGRLYIEINNMLANLNGGKCYVSSLDDLFEAALCVRSLTIISLLCSVSDIDDNYKPPIQNIYHHHNSHLNTNNNNSNTNNRDNNNTTKRRNNKKRNMDGEENNAENPKPLVPMSAFYTGIPNGRARYQESLRL